MERTSSFQVVTFFLVHLIIVLIFSSFSNAFTQVCCQHQSSRPAIRVLNSLLKHLKNTRKKDCLQFWDGLKLHSTELFVLLICIHNYFAIFSWIQWSEKILKMALISGSQLKLTLCNKLTHLLQGTTQTMIVHHISPFLLSNTFLFSDFFFPFHFVTFIHAGDFLKRDSAISVSFPTYPCLPDYCSKLQKKTFYSIIFHYFNCPFLTYFLIISTS